MPDLIPSRPLVKRPSCLWAWLRAVGFGIQLMFAAYFVLIAVSAYVARTRLQAALADMDHTDPGWRLPDIEAARAVVPDADNSALRVMEASKRLPQLPSPWLNADFDTELQHLPPERLMSPVQFARLRQLLDAVQPALDEAKKLKDLPNGRFPIVYARNPINTMLEEEQKVRAVTRLLNLNSTACAEAGEAHKAIESCSASLNGARAIGDEPFAISQLIRVACAINACKTAERILAQTEPGSDDLKRLQEAVEREDTHPYWSITWRGDRAFENAVLEALESGAMTLSEFAEEKPDWSDQLLAFAIQDYIRGLHPQLFAYSARIQAASELPAKLRRPAMEQIERECRHAWGNPVTLLLAAFLKLEDAFLRGHAALRCQGAALAVERYRRLHGDWPQSLDALTPEFIAEVPTDPFTDDPLLYHRLPDGVVIYSVSSDGVDNGGNIDWEKPNLPGTDIGFRLWDVAKRRQPPKPDEPAKQP
jgi:hypothetical protein